MLNVGDVVRVVNSTGDEEIERLDGAKGHITKIHQEHNYPYELVFDNDKINTYCLMFKEKELELI